MTIATVSYIMNRKMGSDRPGLLMGISQAARYIAASSITFVILTNGNHNQLMRPFPLCLELGSAPLGENL